jgi:hypothetical protein
MTETGLVETEQMLGMMRKWGRWLCLLITSTSHSDN